MKILRQKVDRLQVPVRISGRPDYNDPNPDEVAINPDFHGGYPRTSFPRGTKFELVETVENGWMDGRGDKHVIRVLNQRPEKFIFRGSLNNAFEEVKK